MPPATGNFNLVAYLQALEQEIRKLSARISGVDYSNHDVPKKDTFGTLSSNLRTNDKSCRIVTGAVVDSMSVLGWYSVQLDDAGFIPCELISDMSNGAVGARRVGTLSPGVLVYVLLNPTLTSGTILGTYQSASVGLDGDTHDYISQAATNTPSVDGFSTNYASSFIKLAKFARGSPIDETSIGEWGRLTESGTGIFVDSFMSFLRADENCGFWAFWHDQLARMHGHNLQIRSQAMDMYSFNDEDELSVITGVSPYLWESLGGFTPKKLSEKRDSTIVQLTQSEFAPTDLLTKGQVPFRRLTRFDGFLGQGFKQQLRIPPPNSQNIVYSLPNPVNSPVVWEEHLALDGNYHMVSSQGIMIAHVPTFSGPTQLKNPEDATGDSRANGYVPTGTGQKIKEGLDGAAVIPGTGISLLADDELAYGIKWRSEHPFYYHSKDWTTLPNFTSENIYGYNGLTANHYLEKPEPEKLRVDHRQEANYHPTLSFVSILRDGTVVIAGPAGEEIRMGGGSIEISCPGDIQLRPGRSLVTLAGRDAIIRAKGNAEISASTEDVRIKAERNMQILAGNSGVGGLLLESKGLSIDQNFTKTGTEVISNGVIIKSPSYVSCLATNIYMKAGAGTSYGTITLDAAEGKGVVSTNASVVYNYVANAVVDYFGQPGKVKAVNYYTEDRTVIAGNLISLGSSESWFAGGGVFSSSVFIINGDIATENSTGMLPSINTEFKKTIKQEYEKIKKFNKTVTKDGNTTYKTQFTELLYSDNRIGNSKTIKSMGFSFRNTAQCKASKFMLYESRWAQRARLSGEVTDVWTEKPVKANENKTYPYPGEDAWTKDTYRKIDATLYTNNAQGLGPIPAGPDYENASAEGTTENTTPNGNYPVIY